MSFDSEHWIHDSPLLPCMTRLWNTTKIFTVLLLLSTCAAVIDATPVVCSRDSVPFARVGEDITVTVEESAEVIVLDGSLSGGTGVLPVTYDWTVTRVPHLSSISSRDILNRAQAKAGFTPDRSGEYEFLLTVSNGCFDDTAILIVTFDRELDVWCDYSCVGMQDNGICEDGGKRSESDACRYGTDCWDCGVRVERRELEDQNCSGIPTPNVIISEISQSVRVSGDAMITLDASDSEVQCAMSDHSLSVCPNATHPMQRQSLYNRTSSTASFYPDRSGPYTARVTVSDGCGSAHASADLDVILLDETLCDDSCTTSMDGYCQDGGFQSGSDGCLLGTDCSDCGVRSPSAYCGLYSEPEAIACCDGDYLLEKGQNITLDSRLSRDAMVGQVWSHWKVLSKPDDSNLQLPTEHTKASEVTFVPDVSGTYAVELMVSNGCYFTLDAVQVSVVMADDYICKDECWHSYDLICDDGGAGSVSQSAIRNGGSLDPLCGFGADCFDCGPRALWAQDVSKCEHAGDPTADAGPSRQRNLSYRVHLDGSNSFDSEGARLWYRWDFAETPRRSGLTNDDLTDRFTAFPSFKPDERGEYHVWLTVSNGCYSDHQRIMISNT